MAKIKPYSTKSFARVSTVLYEKKFRTRLSLPAQKLLYGFACSFDPSVDMFPEWDLYLPDVAQYLGLEPSSNTYRMIRQGVREILANPLEYEGTVNPKTGIADYLGIPWMKKAEIKSSSMRMTLAFNEAAKDYLLSLREFCLLEPKHFKDFNSPYALWLYPYLRNVANQQHAQIQFTLSEIITLTHNEQSSAYTGKFGSKNILARIIGIQKPKDSDVWLPIDGGAMAEINEKSDLYVTCEVEKEGRRYVGVWFYVNFKGESEGGKKKALKRVYKTSYATDQRRDAAIKKAKQGDLFDMTIPYERFEMVAKLNGTTAESEAAKAGYRPCPSRPGEYVKI